MSDPDSGSSAKRAPSVSSSVSSASTTSTSSSTTSTSVSSSASSSTSLSSSSSSPLDSSSSSLPPQVSSALSLPSPFPFADAPDIIRAHQKDAYFAGTLANDLADLVRRFGGGRLAHAWATETRTAAELAYWGLTTWLGHRTLGEEYCDLVEVTAAAPQQQRRLLLPSVSRRTALVLGSVLAPYLVGRTLPGVRKALRRRLEAWVEREEARVAQLKAAAAVANQKRRKTKGSKGAKKGTAKSPSSSVMLPIARYLLTHLDTLTSGAHVRAVTLALFYFYGAYYTIAARLLGIRYVFTRRRDQGGGGGNGGSSADDVVGYEVLGALLVLQLGVQSYMHVRDTLSSSTGSGSADSDSARSASLAAFGPVEVSLDHDHSYTANNELLLGAGGGEDTAHTRANEIARLTNTPAPPPDHLAGPGVAGPRFDLQPANRMKWLGSRVQRQCTLCLEMLQDPAATPCGHVFCWRCIGDWVREKPECPLCRRGAQPQHILPLRAI